MDPSEIRIEDVLKKWERYHPPPPNDEADEKPWYQQPVPENSITNPRRRTRRNVAKTINDSLSNDGVIGPKRFRVLPPVLDIDINNYKVSQCIKCQNTLQYHPAPSRAHLKSQTLSLFDIVHSAGKNFSQRFGYCFVQNIVSAACYQSKDEMLLREINKKRNPVLFVCESEINSFSALLVHMFCSAIGRVPYSVVRDDDVPSPLLKYLMKVFGFQFVSGETDVAADKLVELLRADNHVLVCMQENTASSQKLLYAVLNRLRNDPLLPKRVLLMPTAISTERDVIFENNYSPSWWDAVKNWLFCRVRCGLVHFNISRSVNLHSLFSLADEMNHQKVENEENALIQRHIASDLLETGAILPTHLLAFLFINKFRDCVSYDVLEDSTDWLVKELRSMERFVGFSGNINDILDHALDFMLEDGLIDMDICRNVTVRSKCCNSLQKLFSKAKKIIHVFIVQAITASSIFASVGGRKELRMGSGYSVQCKNDKLSENADKLSEMLSFLIDFSCPLNDMSDILLDSVEKMVTQDILQACSDIYESQTHQKLVHRFAIDSGWEDDQQDDDMAAMTSPTSSVQYSVAVHDDDVLCVLEFLHRCIQPFLEVCFNVMALIREVYGKREEFTAEMILHHLVKRFDSGFFIHGEMVSLNYVSRVLEYMFEKMIIDDVEDHFVLSEGYTNTGEMEEFLQNISLFR